jgi:hypothetical protein
MKINNLNNEILSTAKRRKYQKPVLKHLGSVRNLTTKLGSTSDFGGAQYNP